MNCISPSRRAVIVGEENHRGLFHVCARNCASCAIPNRFTRMRSHSIVEDGSPMEGNQYYAERRTTYWFHPSETNWFVNNLKEKQITGRYPVSMLKITSSKVSAGPLYMYFNLCVATLMSGPWKKKALLYGLTKSVAHRLIKMRTLYIMNYCSITTEENRHLLAIAPLTIREKNQRWLRDRRKYKDIDDNPWIIWPSTR